MPDQRRERRAFEVLLHRKYLLDVMSACCTCTYNKLIIYGIDLRPERKSVFKYCACAAAALSTGAFEDRMGGEKESRHDTCVGQSYYKLACTVPTKRFGLQLSNAL